MKPATEKMVIHLLEEGILIAKFITVTVFLTAAYMWVMKGEIPDRLFDVIQIILPVYFTSEVSESALRSKEKA